MPFWVMAVYVLNLLCLSKPSSLRLRGLRAPWVSVLSTVCGRRCACFVQFRIAIDEDLSGYSVRGLESSPLQLYEQLG